jgi:membrane-bound metal-dependent hydrolase YbcI (DUF457 family)
MRRLGKNLLYSRFFALIIATGFLFPAFSIIGVGVHYGLDMTMSMDNKVMEQTSFSNLNFSLSGIPGLPSTFSPSTVLTSTDIPVYINRKNWENTGINLGGKLYIDVIPFIDAIEVSANFGVWQYEGSVLYPKSIAVRSSVPARASKFGDFVNITYDTLDLTLKNLWSSKFFWGVDKTPYAKLHCDATVRKYLLQIPPILKTVKFYGGLGMSIDFATPMLSSKLIEEALGSDLDKKLTLSQMPQIFDNQEIMKKILIKIISDLMTPHYGCHVALGAMIKIPMIPLGFYVDGKYIIRFDDLDKYVNVGGSGFLVNFGAALAF